MQMNYYSADASLNYDSLDNGTWCAKIEHIDESCTVLVWIDGIESKLPCKSVEHANSVIKALQGKYVGWTVVTPNTSVHDGYITCKLSDIQ